MAATKTSLAWQEFRHSNLVSTSAPAQERDGNDYSDDSDGAERDGFVEADSNATQMMVEIMDKYVQAGEALAEKENDMRQLMKQVDELKRQKSDLESRTSQLTEANEKLADSEGRWYSLAMELEDQMGVIKKGETYTLFQDKVDEAEARLEVATEANNVNKKRLYEIYGLLSDASGPNSTGEGPVDEHHLQATSLAQLQHLKDVEEACTVAQVDHEAEVEKMKNQAQAQEDARASIQKELEKLREDAERSDAAYKSQVEELQEALEGVKISCSEAEARAEDMDKARAKALESLDVIAADLELEREESRCLQETITHTRADLASSQQEVHDAMQLKQRAQEAAEANARQSAKRLAELETACQEEMDSRQHVSELLEKYRDEVHSARAHAAAQESQLMDSSKTVDELEDAIRVVRSQLTSQLEEVQHNAEENARLAADRQKAVEELRQELKIAQAEASAGQQFAAQVNALRLELEKADAEVNALRLELKRTAEEAKEQRLESEKADAEVDALRLELKRTAEEAKEQRLESTRANTEVTAAREQALQQTRELSEELERAHEAAAVDSQRQSAHALSLEQELDNVKKGFATAVLRHAAEMEDLRGELQVTRVQAEDARKRHHIEIEKMHKASTSAASAAQKSAVRVEEVLRELSRVSATARERTESVTLLRQELNDAQAAILAAQKEAKDSRDARLEAEGAFSVTLTKEAQAKEEALRAQDTRLREMKQALEKSVQQTQKLSQDMRNLEARLDEATSHGKEAEMEGKRLRTALQESEGKVADLDRSLTATRAELDGKTEEVAKLIEESLANAASSSMGRTEEGKQTVDLDHHTSNGETVSAAVANGHGGSANSSHGAELGQLQAQAEAMELELRCTIESFDGQLNAMAREKLAIQKQVKELTGQCTTLRKQVSHYKKQAKESEAHVEQIVELQHQLCATEATAGSLRDTNVELKSRIDLLEADKVSSAMWQQSKNEASRLRARLEEAEKLCKAKQEELAAKTQDAKAAITRSSELKRQVEEVTSELSSAKASFAAMETEMGTGRTRISKLEELVGEMEGEKQHLKDFAEARRSEAEEARSKFREVEESIRSLREEKDTLVCATQRADEERSMLVSQLREISETLIFSGSKEGSTVIEGITALKERVTTTENLLQETAKALGGNGGTNPEDRTKWVINGIRTLQSRLQMAESNLRDSTEAQERAGCVLKVLKELSSILECDGDMVIHKVAELKKLTLDLFQQRDVNLKEIQSLKDEALRSTRDLKIREDSINGDSTGNRNGQVYDVIQEAEAASTMTDSTNPVDGARWKVLSDIQEMLGCKMEEVMATLEEQQALVQQHHVTGKVLGEIMQSYLYNMDRLASFIAPEDYSRVCSLLAKASDVWSQGVFVNTTREGLDLVDEVTKMLTDIIPGALAESAAYQSALHRAGEEVERLKETMRKERLMMAVFRRWGHFYLAVSNEALRKRTKDRNHARRIETQRGITASSQTCEMSPPDGLVSKRKPVKLPQTILQAVLDQEYLKATRELASQPTTSLLALSRARQEMDTMTRKMQDTLGSLMSQPPPTFHDTEDDEEPPQSGQHVVEELPQSGQHVVEEPPQSGQLAVEELPQSGQLAVEELPQSGQLAVEEPPQSGQQHDAGPAPRDGSDVNSMSQQSIPVAKAAIRQTTGPLVEDGISKEERARFLREQREQRKANRKKMNKNINRPNPPVTDGEKTTSRDAISLPPTAPTVMKQEKATEHDTIRTSSSEESTQTVEKEPTPSENGQRTPVEESSSTVKIDPPSSSTNVTSRPVVTAPPPRMFNPTNAAPPTGVPPRAAITTVSQTQRHPTMAFSVNETVEKALKEAKREASLADRRAMFWLRRFRDLAVLAASFTILSFSSDRSFDDC